MADPGVRQWFDDIDQDRNGSLDAKELQQALARGNLQFGLEQVDAIAFDTNNTRTLTFEEFQRLHVFLVNVSNSFNQFDHDKSGSLDLQEVNNALLRAGFTLDPPALEAMVSKFDCNGNRVLTLDEFIRACLFLQTAARTFSAFDTQRSGQVTLRWSQFVYACRLRVELLREMDSQARVDY